MSPNNRRLGILVGGGPAPGINGAISACVIEAVNSGLEVTGIYDGFAHLVKGEVEKMRPLVISDVSRVHSQGGSILRTSRTNPTKEPDGIKKSIQTLKGLGIEYLVTIGGDDTAYSASELAKAANGDIRVAHIPKTIDNDLPLPGDMPTFGFETARHVGTELVLNLMEDSRSTDRWYFVTVMGRNAGHLALGIGISSGATITVIPEEFRKAKVNLDDITDVLEGAIIKRRVAGHNDGIAVIAEGVAELVPPEQLAAIPGVDIDRDPFGHIRLGEIPLATILKRQVQQRFVARGESFAIIDATMGYELRSAPPIPFDIEYTRTLGHWAVRFLLDEPAEGRLKNGGLVCMVQRRLTALPFEDLREAGTDRPKVRRVDVDSQLYRVAREYMIRLKSEDIEDTEMCAMLAEATGMTPQAYAARYRAAATL
ncbi:MAG: 6-phosphofructokinase [Chloroflexi bacterium]|nr:6-phosphofructokinase [Chloroflexota bacterium]